MSGSRPSVLLVAFGWRGCSCTLWNPEEASRQVGPVFCRKGVRSWSVLLAAGSFVCCFLPLGGGGSRFLAQATKCVLQDLQM